MNPAPLPPHDTEAEEAVLGAVVAGGERALDDALAAGLRSEQFYSTSRGAAFAAALALRGRGDGISGITIADELERRGRLVEPLSRHYINGLGQTVIAISATKTHAEIVVRKALARRDLAIAKDIVEHATNGGLADADRAELARRIIPPPTAAVGRITIETSAEFSDRAGEGIRWRVRDLVPEGALAFIPAGPKSGKTWLALELAVSVALGRPAFGMYPTAQCPVLYVALEGHRAALRDRYHAITRGHGADPDAGEPSLLRWAYRPRGINLSDAGWAAELVAQAAEMSAGFLFVDVLRRAARIRETGEGAQDFAVLLANLSGLDQATCLGLLHHFGKDSDTNRQRRPGERMTGSGALFGAADVVLSITKMEKHPTRLTIEPEIRDAAAPGPFAVVFTGEPTGPHGGYRRTDTLRLVVDHAAAADEGKKAPAGAIAAWIAERGGAGPGEITKQFDISSGTLAGRREMLKTHGIEYIAAGAKSRYVPRNPTLTAIAGLGREEASNGVVEPYGPPNPQNPQLAPCGVDETPWLSGSTANPQPAPLQGDAAPAGLRDSADGDAAS